MVGESNVARSWGMNYDETNDERLFMTYHDVFCLLQKARLLA